MLGLSMECVWHMISGKTLALSHSPVSQKDFYLAACRSLAGAVSAAFCAPASLCLSSLAKPSSPSPRRRYIPPCRRLNVEDIQGVAAQISEATEGLNPKFLVLSSAGLFPDFCVI